jgi:hypothetical protein
MSRHLFVGAIAALLITATSPASASDYTTILHPAKPGMPLAHPIATNDIAPPPLSLIADRPVRPAYVPGLPGLAQNRVVSDDFGRKPPKFDGVFIRKSRVENGDVVIPPGGLVYHEDTWGGEVALRGEQIPVLGRLSTYVDYNMTTVVKENITIPAGQSVVVGGQVYHYYATVGHNKTANHTLHVKTIAGTDWEWAFGAPVLSSTQTGWWSGKQFAQLYNQGKAREVTPQKMVFDWLSGVRMDRIVLADEKIFSGLASIGDEWKAGSRTVRLTAVDTVDCDRKIAFGAFHCFTRFDPDFVLVGEHESEIMPGRAADGINRETGIAGIGVAIAQAERLGVDLQISLAVLEWLGPW